MGDDELFTSSTKKGDERGDLRKKYVAFSSGDPDDRGLRFYHLLRKPPLPPGAQSPIAVDIVLLIAAAELIAALLERAKEGRKQPAVKKTNVTPLVPLQPSLLDPRVLFGLSESWLWQTLFDNSLQPVEQNSNIVDSYRVVVKVKSSSTTPSVTSKKTSRSSGGGEGGGGGGTNTYGGANPPQAPNTPPPSSSTSPYTTPLTSNPTGGSANKKQGVFSVH